MSKSDAAQALLADNYALHLVDRPSLSDNGPVSCASISNAEDSNKEADERYLPWGDVGTCLAVLMCKLPEYL